MTTEKTLAQHAADILADWSYFARTGRNQPSTSTTEELAVSLRALSPPEPTEGLRAHKIMTSQEYRDLNLKGWHMVCRDYDGPRSVGIRYTGDQTGSIPLQDHTDDDDHMVKISKLIEDMQEVHRKFGDTCVYIRRGGLSWGAVALNRRDDDKKHGVFDLQAQHDRDMLARLEQIGRLKQSRDEWMEKSLAGPMVAEDGTK